MKRQVRNFKKPSFTKERDMKKYLIKTILISMSIICGALIAQGAFAAATETISIGLSTEDAKASFSSKNGPLTITSASGEKAVFKSTAPVSLNSAGILTAGSLKLKLPVTIQGQGLVYWNNRPYRGYFRLVSEGRGFNVVNILNVEDYLKGVLKMEVNPAWPIESLKAQAIIARTYAFRSRNKHGSNGFDLCATNHCQVYRGVNAEDPILSRAIDSTRGIVLKYQGSFAATFYHSDSGGCTADVASVWGSNIPYLRAKPEPVFYESPYSRWQVTLGLSEIQRILSSKGINLGTLVSIEISSVDTAGRAEMITLKGSAGSNTMRSSLFRTYLGSDRIKSTFFTIGGEKTSIASSQSTSHSSYALNANDPVPLTPQDEQLLISLTRKGVFNSEELMDMLLKPERRSIHLKNALQRQSGCSLPSITPASTSMSNKDSMTFTGKGWGHGVGMSQWGAKSLAETGWDYIRILQHYFPGTVFEKVSH